MGKTRMTLILALLCMAVACREAHIDDTTEQTFNDSLMKLYADHPVEDAQTFGKRLVAAQEALGKDTVRKALHGKSWAEAKAWLDQATAKGSPPHSEDPAKG